MNSRTSLADTDAQTLLTLYRRKEVSPVEVLAAVKERIEQCEGAVNAFSHLDLESAQADAVASEARWAKGQPAGLVDGIPTTVKDLLLARGWPTLRGSKTIDAKQPWAEDAPAVARLRENGAILLGKTTTPEFGWKGVCDSPQHGVTRNPWNLAMTPGGSSGGAGVAAALGMGCLHIGTDGGGSIRIPSSFSGVFGLKPTFGLVPAYPLSPFGRVAHLGPMTRSVTDAAAMLTVMAQPDVRDWHSLPHRPIDYRVGIDAGITGLRVALSPTLGYASVDPEVRAAVVAGAEKLAALGAIVEQVDPGFEDPTRHFEALWWSGAANLRRSIPREKWALLDPGLQRFADLGQKFDHMEYLAAIDACGSLGTHMALFHEKYDVLLTPTVAIPPFEVNRVTPYADEQQAWIAWSPFTYPFNLTQQPAASVPCGFTKSGLPVGMQIVAAKYREDLVLRVARAFESAAPFAMPNRPVSTSV
ncbi:amidase [Caenimonas soli]|uniref:amidase n=1 Tax=Caenimonas soli TaxID=2735555 RepID=UPI002E2CDB48|nr:amidase [Caenimonas soli]